MEYLQQGILHYCWSQPDKLHSYNTLKNISRQLYIQYFKESEETKPERKILMPLLRSGLLEFYGKNKYGLSPSAILYNKSYILEWNIHSPSFLNFINQSEYNNDFGIRLYKNCRENTCISKSSNVASIECNLLTFLSRFPSFQRIVDSWEECSVSDTSRFLFLSDNYAWERPENTSKLGLYKSSEEHYSQRLLHVSEDKWKLVPSVQINVEAFNIATIWSKIQNRFKFEICYFKKEKKLLVAEYAFPFLIERFLLVNTLLNGRFDFKIFNREYFLSDTEFAKLNKLFNNKIAAI